MDAPQPDAVTDAAARLRQAGLRATKPRLAVLGALEDVREHKSADELVSLLRERDVDIPRSSVYNVLADLSAAGLIMHTELGSRGDRYEASSAWHHHLVCRGCGAVVDVPCLVGSHPCLEITVDGAYIEQADVVFRGLCAACVAESASA
jgi:Fe2+ or Zn2+ uptake regulation protein